MAYAENTTVSVERSRLEIEKLLRKAGAQQYISGWDEEQGLGRIQCVLDGLYLRFNVFRPNPEAFAKTERGRKRDKERQAKALAQEERRRWRGLLLIIKAKLELVETGQSTTQREFMADILLPDQTTIGDWADGQIKKIYATGKMPRLLPGA